LTILARRNACCLILERKSLATEVLEEVARRKPIAQELSDKEVAGVSSADAAIVELAAAARPVPDGSCAVAILPGVSAELKRNAEDQLLARLPQLPLGQKITLRGAARRAWPERCWRKGTRKLSPSFWTIRT